MHFASSSWFSFLHLTFFTSLLFSQSTAYTHIPHSPTLCFDACHLFTSNLAFKTKEVFSLCRNPLGVTSLLLCAREFCDTGGRELGVQKWNETCKGTGLGWDVLNGWESVNGVKRIEAGETNWRIMLEVREVVLPTKKMWAVARGTLDTAFFEAYMHVIYGVANYVFWIFVICVGVSSHLVGLIASVRANDQTWQYIPSTDDDVLESRSPRSEGHERGILDLPYTVLKRYITIPATFGYTRSQNIGWCTVPTRIQSITIAAFVIANMVLCSISYRVFEHNLYWPKVSTQLCRYIADRTGVISTANLALVWAFGIRNNTLLWITGWDYATYNNFHRWVARVATVEGVVHSVAYTVLIFKDESWKNGWKAYANYYKSWWFVAGVLATVIMCAVCGFSVYPLRRSYYEVFLSLHIVLSAVIVVTMYYHVEIFSGQYNWFIYPLVIIWIFDRILRYLRILLFNLRFWNTKATITYDSDSSIIRLIVPYSTSYLKPKPGTYYYISSLNDSKPWESHPFTLAYSTSKQEYGTSSSSSISGTITPQPGNPPFALHRRPTPAASRISSSESQRLLDDGTTNIPPQSLVFIIRPYDGFTSRLRSSCLLHPTKQKVLIEGPYGETQALHKYQHVLFIVGGAGISVPLSYLEILLSSPITKFVKIIWAVRESKFLSDTISVDLRGALEDGKISLHAYVTKEDEIDKTSNGENLPGRFNKTLKMQHGRPDVYEEVEEASRDAGNGTLAVVACGPGMMADDCRSAVVSVLGKRKERRRVEYFEESFNW